VTGPPALFYVRDMREIIEPVPKTEALEQLYIENN
jgi:hypothetical protein